MNPFGDPAAQDEFDRAVRWADESRAVLDGLDFKTTNRLRISCTYHRIALDHQVSILVLAQNSLMVSAKALLRPQFDAFVRGVWFKDRATEEQIRDFLDKGEGSRVPPRYEVLFKALDTVGRFDFSFTHLYKNFLPMFHDFTHGGLHQIAAFNSADSIESNFTPEDALATLRSSATLGFLACNELAGNCQRDDLAAQIHQAHQSIYGGFPLPGLAAEDTPIS